MRLGEIMRAPLRPVPWLVGKLINWARSVWARQAANRTKWDAAHLHLVWKVLLGVCAPFALGLILVPLQLDENDTIDWKDLISGGQLHLAVGIMLLSASPELYKGMQRKSRLSGVWLVWQIIGGATVFLMLLVVVVWSRLAHLQSTDGDAWWMASVGGVGALFGASALSYALVWRQG